MKNHINYIFNSKQSDRSKLDNLTELLYRQNGQTTRLVDEYIQLLFTTGEIHIQDHYPNRQANENLMERILDRLQHEHRMTKDSLSINRYNFIIKYKQFEEKQEIKKYHQECISRLKEKLNIKQ